MGIPSASVDYRLAVGRLHEVHRGVYAVGHGAVDLRGRWMAAVLACGGETVLSHRSAAALWELRPTARSEVEVSSGRNRHRRPGITLHRVRKLHSADRTVREEIPVTTVSRTLLDLTEVLTRRELERALDQAERLRLLDMTALDDAMRRAHGRHALRRLRELLNGLWAPVVDTRSELERRFLEVCRAATLPPPAVNALVAGFEVDAAWPNQKLVVELDGYAYHGTRSAFERDRARDAALQLAGYRVLRVTHRRLDSKQDAVVETIRTLLDAAPPAPAARPSQLGPAGSETS